MTDTLGNKFISSVIPIFCIPSFILILSTYVNVFCYIEGRTVSFSNQVEFYCVTLNFYLWHDINIQVQTRLKSSNSTKENQTRLYMWCTSPTALVATFHFYFCVTGSSNSYSVSGNVFILLIYLNPFIVCIIYHLLADFFKTHLISTLWQSCRHMSLAESSSFWLTPVFISKYFIFLERLRQLP